MSVENHKRSQQEKPSTIQKNIRQRCLHPECERLKMAKLVKLVGMLLQTKVYLLWSADFKSTGTKV